MEPVAVDDQQGNEGDLLAHDIGGIKVERGVFGGEIAQRLRGDLLQNCRVDPLRQAAILFFIAIIAPVRVRCLNN